MNDTTTKKPNRVLDNFDFTPAARACLRRLKKLYGTKKNAVETALFNLDKQTKGNKCQT